MPGAIHRARQQLRDLLRSADAVLATGNPEAIIGRDLPTPFGTADPVEGDEIRAIPLAGEPAAVDGATFVDGIQRFAVEGWWGVTPVLRGYAAAAALMRHEGELRPIVHRAEEFVVVPAGQLPDDLVAALRTLELPVYDSGVRDREHPIVDLQRSARVVERHRRRLEREVIETVHAEHAATWVVVDGGLRGLEALPHADRRVGLIKSHETQFLAGVDLTTALTLPTAHRTTVFQRYNAEGTPVYSWYVRFWDWAGQDLLHGLVRVERAPGDEVIEQVDMVSRWLLAERAPISDDGRWDRLVYPMHRVETYLRARAGGWR